MSGYTVTVDTDACDGIFACLVRDPRFVEADDGLATVDPDADVESIDRGTDEVVATFDDDQRDDAEAAAAACPVDAITVSDGGDR